ncbi:phosphomannose isomerase, partial [Metarhizium brunneum ARSEF 3297]
MAPIVVPENKPEKRFYAGGARISAVRSNPPCSSHQPEDWVSSTTCCFATAGIGYSQPASGRDSAHRCSAHLGRNHGKAEAWYILTPGSVWLVLKESIDSGELPQLVETGRGTNPLDRMQKFGLLPRQTLHVPPGTLHAISNGIVVVKIQGPEDLSVLCEWGGFAIHGKNGGHLGLEFPTALKAVDYVQVEQWVTSGVVAKSVLAAESTKHFGLERIHVEGSARTKRGFAILVVLDGKLLSNTSHSDPLPLSKGFTLVIPHEDDELSLQGEADVLIARPPQ